MKSTDCSKGQNKKRIKKTYVENRMAKPIDEPESDGIGGIIASSHTKESKWTRSRRAHDSNNNNNNNNNGSNSSSHKKEREKGVIIMKSSRSVEDKRRNRKLERIHRCRKIETLVSKHRQ